MRKHHPRNELAKREYLAWLQEAGGRSPETIDAAAAAVHRFEGYTSYKDFKTFRREQAISFKAHLAEQKSQATGKPLAKATLHTTLKHLKAFFEWLSREPGYRRAIVHSDAAYFNITDNEARIAKARRQRPAPSVAQVQQMVDAMPSSTPMERRDRAVVCLIMMTGARDSAAASVQLKHLDLTARSLFQDARTVKTKRRKTITAYFFPVGETFEVILRAWVEELTQVHQFGPDDPLFPATRVGVGNDRQFIALGLERRSWTSAAPIREIFRTACRAAGIPYYNPHSLRQTLVRLAYKLKLTPVELKAWTQNLGHDSPLTSLVSYGTLTPHEQADVMQSFGKTENADEEDLEDLLRKAAHLAKRRGSA
jgi:integrase/recombinase XerD